ncbi:MAG: chromosomal replication initiator protein DnaA [Alphaproteobacteria bacterium]|nr:chromosomal replication initiator protein DnaA [Alphaproteobacteria bacterium]
MARDAEAQWRRVAARLRVELGDAAFQSWFQRLVCGEVREGKVTLYAPTQFLRDMVVGRYGERLRLLWQAEDEAVRHIEVAVRGPQAERPPAADEPRAVNGGERPMPGRPAERAGQELERDIGSPLDPRLRFDSFVVGRSNELAYAAARRVAEQARLKFNPLFLHGGVGLGKTHLMQAIAWHIREHDPERRVVYLSAERFMFQFVRAIRDKDQMSFKEQLRSVDVLMVDDVQFISGKNSTQEEFFHTFNALMDQNSQIVISADRSPSDLEDIEERIRSRLGGGLVADIHQTDYELRLSILQAKLNEMPGAPEVPLKVVEFMAQRIASNVRELEGALNRLVAHLTTFASRTASIELAQQVLQDLLRASDRRVTIDEIQKRVASHYNIRLIDMQSARRARNVARPRQVAMYLAKQLTTRSLPEIGRRFGGRDHTTVIHAVKRIEELRQIDSSLAEDIELLRRNLEG